MEALSLSQKCRLAAETATGNEIGNSRVEEGGAERIEIGKTAESHPPRHFHAAALPHTYD
jgi:hypothetical protein